jgi:RNA 3'-terminal phosphate cyclase (ATP)
LIDSLAEIQCLVAQCGEEEKAMKIMRLDGSAGEGGGQILRTAVALAACTGTPVRIEKIRAGRRKPGLMRQHLTAVEAVGTICHGTLVGAEIGSQELEFRPGPIQAGDYRFAVGTAGSAGLVLQTILPPLLRATGPSVLHLEGGTHNPLSPPFHFLAHAFLPVLKRMGAAYTAELHRWGFFPAGGGSFTVRLTPPPGGRLRVVELIDRGDLVQAEVFAGVSQVPFAVADDECTAMVGSLRCPVARRRAEQVPSPGPGNVAMVDLTFEHSRAVFTGFGQMGVSRQKVANQATSAANRFLKAAAAVDEHLADQLLIPMALAGAGRFTTVEPTEHTKTNAAIIERFLPVRISWSQLDKVTWELSVVPHPSPAA